MKWQGRRGSRNIEDRRRRPSRGGGAATGGKIGGMGLIIVLVAGYFLGIDVSPLLNGQAAGNIATSGSAAEITQADERAAEFVSVTLADTEDVWTDIFNRQVGAPYNAPTLVLFKGATQSACGGASAASGPFYCPPEEKAFLDTDFFVTMERQLGAGGDFAAAYVVAHEIAHHVQNELDILPRDLGPAGAATVWYIGAGRYCRGDECRRANRRRYLSPQCRAHGTAPYLYTWHQRPTTAVVSARV